MVYPVEPCGYDVDRCPLFNSWQIELYGIPDLEWFRVIELREDSWPLVADWRAVAEVEFPMRRPVHRYSRVERFNGVVMQLLGLRGAVDESVSLRMERA